MKAMAAMPWSFTDKNFQNTEETMPPIQNEEQQLFILVWLIAWLIQTIS